MLRRHAFILLSCFLFASTSCSRDDREVATAPPEPIRLNPEFTGSTAGTRSPGERSGQLEPGAEISDNDLLLDEAEPLADGVNATKDLETGADLNAFREVATLLEEARDLLQQERGSDAAKTAWAAWKLKPTSPHQIADITQLLIRAKKFIPAIAVVDTAEKAGHANVKARVLLAQACYRAAGAQTVPQRALTLLERAAKTLIELDHDGELATYGRSGAQLLIASLTTRAKLAASLGRRDEAMSVIEQLHEGGFSQLASLLAEPDFDPIRSDPLFAHRVEAIRETVRRQMQPEIERRMAATEPFEFDFSLTDIRGNEAALADYRGKVVLVDFWGTWCGPCRKEIPHLARLSREYGDQLQVIGLAYEKTLAGRAQAKVRDFVSKNAVPYTCAIGDNATKQQVPNFRSFPTMLFLDSKGNVRLKLVGYHGYEQLDAVVHLLINESARL